MERGWTFVSGLIDSISRGCRARGRIPLSTLRALQVIESFLGSVAEPNLSAFASEPLELSFRLNFIPSNLRHVGRQGILEVVECDLSVGSDLEKFEEAIESPECMKAIESLDFDGTMESQEFVRRTESQEML